MVLATILDIVANWNIIVYWNLYLRNGKSFSIFPIIKIIWQQPKKSIPNALFWPAASSKWETDINKINVDKQTNRQGTVRGADFLQWPVSWQITLWIITSAHFTFVRTHGPTSSNHNRKSTVDPLLVLPSSCCLSGIEQLLTLELSSDTPPAS